MLTNHLQLGIQAPPVQQYSVAVYRLPPPATGEAAAQAAAPGQKGGSKKGPAQVAPGPESRQVVQQLLGEAFPNRWVYDGASQLFTVEPSDLLAGLPAAQPDGSVRVALPATEEGPAAEYKVELKRVGLIDVQACISGASGSQPAAGGGGTYAALAVLDLVTRAQAARDPSSVRVGSGAFVSVPPAGQGPRRVADKRAAIQGLLPLQLLRGFRSAVHLAQSGLTLSIDAASAVVVEDGPLLEQLLDAFRVQRSDMKGLRQELTNPRNRRQLVEALGALEVKAGHTGIVHKLSLTSPISASSARDTMFKDAEGRQVSVEQYMKSRYGVALKHPDLPCAVDRKGSALPLELLTVRRSQVRTGRLSAKQKADFIKSSAMPPSDRLKAIRAVLQGLMSDVATKVPQGAAAAFGLGAMPTGSSVDLMKVPAQLLPGPILAVGPPGKLLNAGNDGQWRASQVAAPAAWTSGAVLVLEPKVSAADVKLFLRELGAAARAMGMPGPFPGDQLHIVSAPPGKADTVALMQKAADEARAKYGRKAQLLLVVLPDGQAASGVYADVKAVGDGSLGIPSQCLTPFKMSLLPDAQRRPSPATLGLVMLSINAKLGGTNARLAGEPSDWVPALKGKRLMVMGADVSRGAAATLAAGLQAEGAAAAAAMDDAVEYAAVLGSWDRHVVQYRAVSAAQVSGRRDIIVDMQGMTEDLLRHYKTAHDKQLLPEVLVMYRDGVGNSMFDAVLAHEHTAIKQACAAVGGAAYQPPVVFIVVQKSHGTRIFPIGESGDRSGNVLPGTAVDRGICSEVEFDFFLNSHAGIQGTNRVPRYNVLVNESGLSAESVELLTFFLTHTYPACSRAISIPPAVCYADRAAERVRTSLADVAKKQLRAQQGPPGAPAGGTRSVRVALPQENATFVV